MKKEYVETIEYVAWFCLKFLGYSFAITVIFSALGPNLIGLFLPFSFQLGLAFAILDATIRLRPKYHYFEEEIHEEEPEE